MSVGSADVLSCWDQPISIRNPAALGNTRFASGLPGSVRAETHCSLF